jgi:hypothetical protein
VTPSGRALWVTHGIIVDWLVRQQNKSPTLTWSNICPLNFEFAEYSWR